jgi:hypothetical protein
MKMEQMMERLLAKIDTRMDANTKTMQEKMDATQERMESQISSIVSGMEADRKSDWEEIRAGQEKMASLLSRIEANQVKMDVNLNEIREEIKSGQREMKSIVNAWIADMKDGRKETMAHLEYKEKTSVDMEPEVEHREVPKEEAAVMPLYVTIL